MARTTSTDPSGTSGGFVRLLEPLGIAVSVLTQPGVLTVGVLAGALIGALAGLGGGLAFVRSPAAVVVVPLVLIAILAIWSVAAGAAALAGARFAAGGDARAGAALRSAGRRSWALMLTALPVFAALAALAVVQFAVFLLTQPPDTFPDERPVAIIAAVFVLLFLIDAVAIAVANIALWMLLPYAVVEGDGAVDAYARAREAFWRRPGWSIGVMAGVLAITSMVSAALTSLVALAVAFASAAELLSADELVLLRFSAPLYQGVGPVSTGDFATVVVLTTGLGAAIGGAVGFGQMFGVWGGAGLRRATMPPPADDHG